MTENVVPIIETKKRTLDEINADLQQMYVDVGFVSFRMACDKQILQQKYQKISELNQEASTIPGATLGSK